MNFYPNHTRRSFILILFKFVSLERKCMCVGLRKRERERENLTVARVNKSTPLGPPTKKLHDRFNLVPTFSQIYFHLHNVIFDHPSRGKSKGGDPYQPLKCL